RRGTRPLARFCYPGACSPALNLLALLPAELEELAVSLGAPAYRGRQIASWIYRKGVTDLARMSDLPRDFRDALAGRAAALVPAVEPRTAAPGATGRVRVPRPDR